LILDLEGFGLTFRQLELVLVTHGVARKSKMITNTYICIFQEIH